MGAPFWDAVILASNWHDHCSGWSAGAQIGLRMAATRAIMNTRFGRFGGQTPDTPSGDGLGSLNDEIARGAIHMEERTILGAGCSFEGKLKCRGGARIDGDFEGEILADEALIIGKDSTVTADLNVPELHASGAVKGNVIAMKKVVLAPTAHIHGDLRTPSLIIQEGARIKGHIDVGPIRDDAPSGDAATTADRA